MPRHLPTCRSLPSTFASSSSYTLSTPLVSSAHSYATAPSSSPKDRDSTSSDMRLDLIRRTLYPPDGPNGSTPTGIHHPQMYERLQYVMGQRDGAASGSVGKEVHETITRAWKLQQRLKEKARLQALKSKFDHMQRACTALQALKEGPTAVPGGARLYAEAMWKANPSVRPKSISSMAKPGQEGPNGQRRLTLAEKNWMAARVEGLFPREMEVPRDTWKRGPRWDYEWKRPGK